MKDFRDEFYRYINMMMSKDPFALVRYGDGEHMLMSGAGVSTNTQAYLVDGWGAERKQYKLGQDLLKSLKHIEPNYHYAIPCSCCNQPGKEFYLSQIKQPDTNITYANIFINGNYPLWKNFLQSMGQHVTLIAHKDGMYRQLYPPIYYDTFIPVGSDCVNFWEQNRDRFIEFLQNKFKDINEQLVFVSCGPMAKAIIHHLYMFNPTNRYIDVGSSIDEYIHGKQTRPFMVKGQQYYSQICQF